MSTLTEVAVPAAAAKPLAPRLAALVLLPLAPALVAALRGLLPYFTSSSSADVVADVEAAQGAQNAVVWLGFLAALTLPVAALWAGRPFYAAAPRLTAVAETLLVPAYLCLPWLVATDAVLLHGAEHNVDADVVAGMYEALHPAALVGLAVFVIGHVLGTVLLGIAAIRTRLIPLWAGIALAVCQPLHFAALVIVGSQPLDVAAWGLNAVAFGLIGLDIFRSH